MIGPLCGHPERGRSRRIRIKVVACAVLDTIEIENLAWIAGGHRSAHPNPKPTCQAVGQCVDNRLCVARRPSNLTTHPAVSRCVEKEAGISHRSWPARSRLQQETGFFIPQELAPPGGLRGTGCPFHITWSGGTESLEIALYEGDDLGWTGVIRPGCAARSERGNQNENTACPPDLWSEVLVKAGHSHQARPLAIAVPSHHSI